MAISAPTNWNTLWDDVDSKMLLKLTLTPTHGTTIEFTEADLMSCSLESSLFDDLSIGNATSAHLSFVIADQASMASVFQRESRIDFSVALQKDSVKTAYVKQGVFYVESVEVVNDDDLNVSAYDVIHFFADSVLNKTYTAKIATVSTYLNDCVTGLQSRYGTLPFVNSSVWAGVTGSFAATRIQSPFPWQSATVSSPTIGANIKLDTALLTSLTFGEIISSVAAIAGGNVAISKSGIAKFMHLRVGYIKMGANRPTYYDAESIRVTKRSEAAPLYLNIPENERLSYGFCINAYINDKISVQDYALHYDYSNIKANLVYSANFMVDVNSDYSDIALENCYLSPLVELNDTAYANSSSTSGVAFPIAKMKLDYCLGCWGEIGLPISQNAIQFYENAYMGWDGYYYASFNSAKPAIGIENSRVVRLRLRGTDSSTKYSFILKTENNAVETLSLSISYTSGGTTNTFTTTAHLMGDYLSHFHALANSVELQWLYMLEDDLPSFLVDGTVRASVDNKFYFNVADGEGIDLQLKALVLHDVPRAKQSGVVMNDLVISHETDIESTALPLSNVNAYTTATTPHYKKYGDVVHVFGSVKPKSQVTAGGSVQIGTLPEGFRPSQEVDVLCWGGSYAKWVLKIATTGIMTASNFSNGNTSAAITTSTQLAFSAAFIL